MNLSTLDITAILRARLDKHVERLQHELSKYKGSGDYHSMSLFDKEQLQPAIAAYTAAVSIAVYLSHTDIDK